MMCTKKKDGNDMTFHYNGTFVDQKKSGCGMLVCGTTERIKFGAEDSNQYNLTFKVKATYMGEFANDSFNGEGIMVKATGDF